MATFGIAEKETSLIEGGYVNDPDDPGKETICGVSRRYHPDLELWTIVDSYTDKHDSVKDHRVQTLLHEFYKKKFWDCYLADYICDQSIANEIYDSGVIVGQERAAKWVQTALNVLNRSGKVYADLKIDGKFGAKTLNTLNAAIKHHGEKNNILKLLNAYLGSYFSFKCEENESKEKYIHGWLNLRVT